MINRSSEKDEKHAMIVIIARAANDQGGDTSVLASKGLLTCALGSYANDSRERAVERKMIDDAKAKSRWMREAYF